MYIPHKQTTINNELEIIKSIAYKTFVDKYEVMIGNIINDKEVQDKVGYECYDIVAANILAPILVELTPVIVNQLKPGGIYITSGIIDDKEEMVKEAVAKAGLELLEVTHQGEWVCVTARKNA